VERLQAVAHEEDCNSNGEAVVVVAAMVFVLLPKKPFSKTLSLSLSLSLSLAVPFSSCAFGSEEIGGGQNPFLFSLSLRPHLVVGLFALSFLLAEMGCGRCQ
jgi:hypothetical protein